MNFQPLTLGQIELLRPYFSTLISRTCDYTIGGMLMWRDFYRMEYAVEASLPAVYTRCRMQDGTLSYQLPMAKDPDAALAFLAEHERKNGNSLHFSFIPEEYLPSVRAVFSSPCVEAQENFADYLYAASDLITLKGKKFSGQRNQISQFKRNIEAWSFLPMTKDNLADVLSYHASVPLEGLSAAAQQEHAIVLDVLQHFDAYGMFGGALYANGRIVGFSVGELVGDTLYTHIEKADRNCKGAYQMLVNCFSSVFATEGVLYINREDDTGDLGLRAAKQAYHPIALLPKYTVSESL